MAANSDVGVTEAKGLTGKAVVNGNSAVKSGGSSAAGTIVIIDPPTSSLASTKATSASAIQKLKEEEKKIQMVSTHSFGQYNIHTMVCCVDDVKSGWYPLLKLLMTMVTLLFPSCSAFDTSGTRFICNLRARPSQLIGGSK